MKLDIMGTVIALEDMGVALMMSATEEGVIWEGTKDGAEYTVFVGEDGNWRVIVTDEENLQVITTDPLTGEVWFPFGATDLPDWVKVW